MGLGECGMSEQVENGKAMGRPSNFYDLYVAVGQTPHDLLGFLEHIKARPKDKLEAAFDLGVIKGYMTVIAMIHDLHLDNGLLNDPKTLARLYNYLQGLELTYNAFNSGEIRDKTALIYEPSSITTFIRWFVHDLLEKIKGQGSGCGSVAQGSA
jgi:hypothetical protein